MKEKLRNCFRHLKVNSIYGSHRLVMLLIIHLLLGFRELWDLRYYEDDPMIIRVIGLKELPNVSTLSRTLANLDRKSVENLRELNRQMVITRLCESTRRRITLDFDGCVQSTTRVAQGTAVGYNKKNKGARSYYPLFCTIAQSDTGITNKNTRKTPKYIRKTRSTLEIHENRHYSSHSISTCGQDHKT